MPRIVVETESGSFYDLRPGRRGWWIRRIPGLLKDESKPLHKDGEWLSLVSKPELKVGTSMILLLDPLGYTVASDFTMRRTSRVVKITNDEVYEDDYLR